MTFDVRAITTEETLPIRQPVLRQGLPIASARYPNDKMSVHLGCFENGVLFGVASYCEEEFEGRAAMRLRGMAVLPDAQRKGVGKVLVEKAILDARAKGVQQMWCTARTSAQGFYEGLGFVVKGEVFEVERHGPHVVMVRLLD